MDENPIYLAKNGKTVGPFTPDQISEMTESGELHRYEWIWDGSSPDWKPVPRKAKAPPPRPEITVTKVNDEPKVRSLMKEFSAILYDHETALAGKLQVSGKNSGIFLTNDHQPPFKSGQVVWIDYLEEEKDLAFKIRAAIDKVQHSDNSWRLELQVEEFRH